MSLADVKTALGVGRIVWIDDMFGQAKPELKRLAMRHPEVAAGFPELRDLMAARDYRDVADDVAQVIGDQPDDRQEEIGQALLQADAVADPADELPLSALEAACDALGVAPHDRLGFDDGETFIAAGTAGADVAIVIDLKDAGGPERRGLDLLDRCRKVGFAGVAFIMTHDATIETEAAQEAALRGDMAADAALPITVIAKDRLRADGDVEAAMAVALKRAGLRQVLRPLLSQTGRLVADTYEEVTASLLQLEPERLQRYVYGSAADEGESELQVVERMISAGLSRAVRRFMATDAVALETTRRLRDLPDIALDIAADGPGEAIADLRQAELWDEGDVVNPSYRPLANGDVFEVDAVEPGVPPTGRLFVLPRPALRRRAQAEGHASVRRRHAGPALPRERRGGGAGERGPRRWREGAGPAVHAVRQTLPDAAEGARLRAALDTGPGHLQGRRQGDVRTGAGDACRSAQGLRRHLRRRYHRGVDRARRGRPDRSADAATG